MNKKIMTILMFCIFISQSALPQENETAIMLPAGEIQLSRTALPSSLADGVYVIQFENEFNQRQADMLSERGIRLHQYLGANAYWSEIESSSSLLGLNVRTILQPAAKMKITSGLNSVIDEAESSREIEITVSFIPSLTHQEIKQLIAGKVTNVDNQDYLYGQRVQLHADKLTILSIAEIPEVIAVERSGRPKVIHNKRAVKLAKAKDARKQYGVTGDGINVGIWDGGFVFQHQELKGRVKQISGKRADDHATHVAGTIAAEGLKRKARGFAADAMIYSWDYNGNIPSQMANAVRNYDVLLANNSWGSASGWEWEGEWVWYGDRWFGLYTSETRVFDQVAHNNGLIIVFAAGNDREDEGAGKGRYYDWELDKYVKNKPKSGDGPYDCIGEYASAKNIIAVGAVKDKGSMTAFSSWGPTNDGRVKPEVVANGEELLSTIRNNRYDSYSGTSMASPAVTGGMTLAAQYWKEIRGGKLPLAIARALVTVTATDMGNTGPDYSYGFGNMNVLAMADLIDTSGKRGTAFMADISKNSGKKMYNMNVKGDVSSVKVALAWVDPPAAVNATRTLVNDLDLALISPTGTRHYPWRLDVNNPTRPATKGINQVDNIEIVEISLPKSGNWTIEIRANKIGQGNSQRFALVTYSDGEVLIN